MAMTEPYAVGLLAEFAESLRIMSTKGMPVGNVEFDFDAEIVTFTYQWSTEVFRLEPSEENEGLFLIKFPTAKKRISVGSRERFWRLVRLRYDDLDFIELEPEFEIRLASH